MLAPAQAPAQAPGWASRLGIQAGQTQPVNSAGFLHDRLAALGQAAALGRALAQKRVASRGAAFGFLYVDGHVRVYHGKHTLPKTHVAQMRRAMPATSDYWVNDAAGEPLFVLTAEANAGMVKMLPIVLAASVLGAIVGIVMKLGSTLREGRYVPFGPFLAGAGLVVMLAGERRVLGWLGWV